MAQVSYGTITITDTNDIESIIVEYARNQSTSSAPTSGWSTTRPTWAQGYYIWQRTRTHKAGTSTDSDTYGTAVCITGSTGQTGGTGAAGRSLTNTVTEYTTATNSATITQNNMSSYTWNSNVPSYSSSTPAYWVRVTNTYSNPSSTEYIIYKDNGLTDAIAKSVEANNNAAMANSISQSANENAQGAMSQAAAAQYQAEALDAKLAYFFYPGDSNYPGVYAVSGISGTTFNESSISTYGYNVVLKPASISIGYNTIKTVELEGGTPSLKFYVPSKTTQATNPSMVLTSSALTFNKIGTANKAVELTSSALNFYGSSTSSADATLTSTGLKLAKGGIQAGTAGQSGFVYLSTNNYGSNLTINSHQASNWKEIVGTKFGVDADGNLYASNANITGAIVATSGIIGGWNIGTDANKSLFYGNQQPGATTNNLVISSSSAENTIPIAGSGINKHWFLSAGTKFGVDTEGNLYANNANLSNATVEGAIIANSLTIDNNGSSYNAWDAINITGYSLDIEVDATGIPTSDIYNNTYLYPHLYHNGTEITLPSSATTAQKQEFYNKFLWYEGDSTTAQQGDYLNKGRILASYGDYWKVTYSFNDGATEGAEPIQQVIVDPSTYITRINDNTIKVHSKNWDENTGFVQINNQGNIIATGQVYQENNIPLTTVQLIKW